MHNSAPQKVPLQSCPKCRYTRTKDDAAPEWQCPNCGVAYAKAQLAAEPPATKTTIHVENKYGQSGKWHTLFTTLVLLSILLFVISWWLKSSLPDSNTILPVMQNEPIQSRTSKRPFTFAYRDADYNVVPVAEYEIWGMVVSHNNITGWTDIMHTENSVDLKDICVIWGTNVGNGDYQKISFSSGDFTCYARWPGGVNFDMNRISNNHLLSNNPFVRRMIRNAKIGDQVHMKGILVNYSPASNPDRWRNTSTIRTDTGNGACEVLFVNDFQTLKSSNAIWYFLYSISAWLILITILIKLASYYFLPAGKLRQK